MAVPTLNRIHRTVLEIADGAHGRSLTVKEFIEQLIQKLRLTEEDLNQKISSGNTKVYSRTLWSLSLLTGAELLESMGKGSRRITQKGQKYLIDHIGEIRTSELQKMQRQDDTDDLIIIDDEEKIPPDKQIAQSYQELQSQLADEILDKVKELPPDVFEKLVTLLLSQMDYGKIERATGGSRDQGIDGILNQDPLGLEKVYVQAKRYTTGTVGAPRINEFSGSLTGRGATKGVFITTADFTSAARQAAEKIAAGSQSIRLIDGEELAALMLKHNVGVVTDGAPYEIKKLDANYFTEV